MAMTGLNPANAVSARNQISDYAGQVNTKVPCGLAAALRSANQNNARATELLGRLFSLADTLGGSEPQAASEREKAPPALGYLGQINEANGAMSSVLGQIEEEIGRLEGLVG